MKRLLLAAFAVLFVVACGGGGGSPSPGGPFPSPLPEVDLANADPSTLVYWYGGRVAGDDIPVEVDRLFETIRRSSDDRWTPFLLDLATIPTPFSERARESLEQRLGGPGELNVFGWVEKRGERKPSDDTQDYLAFKQRLFSTIQPEIGAFVDPKAKRDISAQEILWGGVRVDGIPPLESPKFVTPKDAAAWISASDQVLGVEINGDARAYPRRIIDWHEMVNDTIGGVPVSLAYCTLCGSAILYDGRIGGTTYRFGTSGMLYRSNKLMYDRQTRTLWEQYTGVPVWGELAGSGIELKLLPVTHTSYGEWLAEHPETKVLDIDTGFRRDYGSGVAYGEYFASPQLMFPAPRHDGRLQLKEVVYAVRLDGALTAYPVKLLDKRGFITDSIAGTKIVVLATADGSGGRAYAAGSTTFTKFDRRKSILTASDGRAWKVTEGALVAEGGQRLERLPGHNSFWFAVINHTENGRLFGE